VRIALVTAGAFGTNRRAARGRRCLHGLSGVTLELLRSDPSPGRLGDGGERGGGQSGESQTLENGWIQRVLVDIKSVAEIGERHLVCLGSERFGERARVRRARARRPITVTGGKPGACSKGASTVWSSTIQSL
jgi:hypothetical protein